MTPSQRAELGTRRCKYRFRFREILEMNGYSCEELAAELGMSGAAVTRTIRGTLHSSKVLDWFKSKGLSEKYLCDPRTARRADPA